MELQKHYEPASTEKQWNQHWKDKHYFESIPDLRPPFTVVIPPPNVTGVLHMGHTLNETVQDILVRRARMSGFNACWVPGSDHASIATEAKVVQMLRERGIRKSGISREEFLRYAFEWKEKYGNIIYNQIDRLGCSVDWNRVSFTMDDEYYKAVIKVFVDLYNKKLIYRGARMIHWDPAAKTALSDEEVEYREVAGKLYYIRYNIYDPGPDGKRGKAEFISIATQRPETIMGDTAVCVNPNDERYAHLKGKMIVVPLVNRVVPLIFDDYVDKEFGTGALKVTPAHDINDYNLGLKHQLPVIDTLNEDGTLSAAAEVFVGLDRFEARIKVVQQLREDGLLLKEEDYSTRLGFSQRSGAVVEPRISTQWFVKMKELAGPALKEVTEGRITIHPGEKFSATYRYWLENVKDWCISRQLWWGQQIPAWYTPSGEFAVAETKEEAFKLLKTQNNSLVPDQIIRDEDVLDTWFSSWLWPIEVFNGITRPGNEGIKYYYPTSVLVTGQDIIFFWVARMIMAGMEYMHEKPFSDVYFTGMVRDKQGRKMSKSLGNSPDLLELIDKYGADAVRFGIMISSPAGNDLLFDDSSCDQGRNFNNKLWNALKLIRSWELSDTADANYADFALKWFEEQLRASRITLDEYHRQFRLSEALKLLYSLIWDDFCSWYLEWIKPPYGQPINEALSKKTIAFFDELLQLLHPFMPFITEDVYHRLTNRAEGDDICIRQFQPAIPANKKIVEQGKLLQSIITSVRDTRNKNKISPKEPIQLYIESTDRTMYAPLEDVLRKQLNATAISYVKEPVTGTIHTVIEKDKFYIETSVITNTASQKEQLIKDRDYLKGFLEAVDRKLGNEKFVQNARPEVVETERRKKADAEEKIKAIEESLVNIQA